MKTYWLCLLFGHKFIGTFIKEENPEMYQLKPLGCCIKCGRTKEEIFTQQGEKK